MGCKRIEIFLLMNQVFKTIVPLLLGVALLCGLLVFGALAWSEPAAAPPDGNVVAAINTGAAVQVRSGALGFGETDPSKNNDPYYIKETGGTFQLIPGMISITRR